MLEGLSSEKIGNSCKQLPIKDFNNGEILEYLPILSDSEVDVAIQKSYDGFRDWKKMPLKDKLLILAKSGEDLFHDNTYDELVARAGLFSQKVVKQDRETVAKWLIHSREYMKHFLGEERVNRDLIKGLGTIGVIVQSSMYQTGSYGIIEPLRAGNSVLLKLDAREPFSEFQLAQILQKNGAPVEQISVDTKNNPEIGTYILNKTDRLLFMGSPKTLLEITYNPLFSLLENVVSQEEMNNLKKKLPLPAKALSYSAHNAFTYLHSDANLEDSIEKIIYSATSHYRSCKRSGLTIFHPDTYSFGKKILLDALAHLNVGEASDKNTDIVQVNTKLWIKHIMPYLEDSQNFGNIVCGGNHNEPTVIEIDLNSISDYESLGLYLSKEVPFAILNLVKGNEIQLKELTDFVAKYLPNHKFLEASIFTASHDSYLDLKNNMSSYNVHKNQPTTWGLGVPEEGEFRLHEGTTPLFHLSYFEL